MPSCKKIGAFVLCLGLTIAVFIFVLVLVAVMWYANYAFGIIFIGGLIYHNIISAFSCTTAFLKGGISMRILCVFQHGITLYFSLVFQYLI